MKNFNFHKHFIAIALMFSSINAVAQFPASGDHVTISASNCVQTGTSTMNIDLYIVNDGTTSMELGGLTWA